MKKIIIIFIAFICFALSGCIAPDPVKVVNLVVVNELIDDIDYYHSQLDSINWEDENIVNEIEYLDERYQQLNNDEKELVTNVDKIEVLKQAYQSFLKAKQEKEELQKMAEELLNETEEKIKELYHEKSFSDDIDLIKENKGVSITWKSSKKVVVGNDGKIIPNDKDQNVSFTATLTLLDNTREVVVKVVILNQKEKMYMKEIVSDLTVKYTNKTVTTDLILPTNYKDTITIAWSSSDTNILTNEGKIKDVKNGGKLTLTASLSSKTITQTLTFDITVEPSNYKDISKGVVAAYVYNGTYSKNKVNDKMLETVDIIYASFVLPNADGSIYMSDYYLECLNDYMEKAHKKGVRVVLCIGQEGSQYCKNFSKIANNAGLRKTFINNVITLINKYKFDGVDIDWEYPGYNTGVDTSIDKIAYTNLIKELNEAVKSNNSEHLVTSAIPAGPWGYVRFNLATSSKYLDYINLMSYDMQAEGKTSHHSALYPSTYAYKGCSVDESVDLFVNNGVSKNKIIIGAAFYGRASTVPNAQTPGGIGSTIGAYNQTSKNGSTVQYTKIVSDYLNKNLSTIKRYWDDSAKAPYIYDSENHVFITYDDPISIGYKCDYVKSKGVGGIMYWDNGSDATGNLIDAIYDKLNVMKG